MCLSWSACMFVRSFAGLEDMFGADDEDWAIYRKIVTITLAATLSLFVSRADLRWASEHCSCIIR